jgi:hypothetical protein
VRVWNRKINVLSRAEIMTAIDNDVWQSFRLSLKGVSTEKKLMQLESYLRQREERKCCSRVEYVRVDNYINALLRGGQLVRDGLTVRVQR